MTARVFLASPIMAKIIQTQKKRDYFVLVKVQTHIHPITKQYQAYAQPSSHYMFMTFHAHI